MAPSRKRSCKAGMSHRKLRVAAYCRVSSDKEEQRSSLDSQIQYYQEQITACEGWDFAGIFSDRGSGLKDEERTALQAMMKKCRQGKIDLILTKSISRFGRNTLNTLITARELKALGVDVWFEKEHIHLLSEDSEMMLTAYAMFAQAENYQRVKAKYLRGEAPIAQLVDAQDLYTHSKVDAMNAQYNFFKELLWVQRGLLSINWTKASDRAKKWIHGIPDILPAVEDFTL